MRFSLGRVQTGFYGFQNIIDLAVKIDSATSVDCEVDMSNVGWLDANMCAPLGAVLSLKHTQGFRIKLLNISDAVEKILQKNHFLSLFGRPAIPDRYETTIRYRHFEGTPAGRSEFQDYVNTHFRQGSLGLPQMTPALLKRFRESLFEIFENALEHSYTEHGVFACGQYFPKKKRMDFTVADLGIGFHGNISRKLGVRFPPNEAIEWAVSGKTSRRGRPGGLGLRLLHEFISHNRGRVVIVSDVGYRESSRGKVSTKSFSTPFPGTAVTIEINTADNSSYCLSTELDPSDIF